MSIVTGEMVCDIVLLKTYNSSTSTFRLQSIEQPLIRFQTALSGWNIYDVFHLFPLMFPSVIFVNVSLPTINLIQTDPVYFPLCFL